MHLYKSQLNATVTQTGAKINAPTSSLNQNIQLQAQNNKIDNFNVDIFICYEVQRLCFGFSFWFFVILQLYFIISIFASTRLQHVFFSTFFSTHEESIDFFARGMLPYTICKKIT